MSALQIEEVVEARRPGDDGYEDSTRGFFGNGRPGLVVRPNSTADVSAAVTHAAGRGLTVAVRSGGHGPLGLGNTTGAMLIDLARRDHVRVLDAARRLVRVGGGATWGQVAAALDPYGWAITAGDTNSVGVGGLTLGGGVGWLVRRYGLAMDNLVGARVVTADGRVRTASHHEHPDLFWALRGGGGNFGVVVDFDFVAQPVSTVRFGTVTYQVDDPVHLMTAWRDVMRAAPEELSSTLALPPHAVGTPATANVLLCWAGQSGTTSDEADAAIEPLCGLGTVTATNVADRRYCEVMEDVARPPQLRPVVRNTLVADLDEAVIGAVHGFRAAVGPAVIALRSLGGAFGRVPPEATAFAHRDAEAMIVALLMLPDTAADSDVDDVLAPWRPVMARGTGTYLNFQGSASAADIAAAYPPATYARLAVVKRAYDPGNLFARNHNIAPGRSVDRPLDGSDQDRSTSELEHSRRTIKEER